MHFPLQRRAGRW